MATKSVKGGSLTLSLDRAPADSRRNSDYTVAQDSFLAKNIALNAWH